MIEAKPDDLRVLQGRGFVHVFDEKVLVILDWKENNFLRTDRYTESKYMAQYKDEIEQLSSGIPLVYQRYPQDRIGKDRLEEDKHNTVSVEAKEKVKGEASFTVEGTQILKAFEEVNPACKTYYSNKTQRAACDHLLKEYGMDKVLAVIRVLPQSNRIQYLPNVTTPLHLKDKWAQLEAGLRKKKTEAETIKNKYPVI
jgi:hypothetical protein